MANNNASNDDYPFCLNVTRLPPNHNHFIGPVQAISMDNIRGVLALTRRLLAEAEGQELWLSEDQNIGLTCILDNAAAALQFEQYYRQRPEEPSDGEQTGK